MDDRSRTADGDVGLVPWTLACLAWLLMPLVALPFVVGCAAFAWLPLAGAALVWAAVLSVVAWLRGRAPSHFTRRAILHVLLQAALVGATWLVAKWLAG